MKDNTTADFREGLLPDQPIQTVARIYKPTQQDKIEK